jgi:hypothetical protein
LYFSPNVSQKIKRRRMRWKGHVTSMAEKVKAYRVWGRNLKSGDHLKHPDVAVRIL